MEHPSLVAIPGRSISPLLHSCDLGPITFDILRPFEPFVTPPSASTDPPDSTALARGNFPRRITTLQATMTQVANLFGAYPACPDPEDPTVTALLDYLPSLISLANTLLQGLTTARTRALDARRSASTDNPTIEEALSCLMGPVGTHIVVDNDSITIDIPGFTYPSLNLRFPGTILTITDPDGDDDLKVYATFPDDDLYASMGAAGFRQASPHPHINDSGLLCTGSSGDLEDAYKERVTFKFFSTLLTLISNYNLTSAYSTLFDFFTLMPPIDDSPVYTLGQASSPCAITPIPFTTLVPHEGPTPTETCPFLEAFFFALRAGPSALPNSLLIQLAQLDASSNGIRLAGPSSSYSLLDLIEVCATFIVPEARLSRDSTHNLLLPLFRAYAAQTPLPYPPSDLSRLSRLHRYLSPNMATNNPSSLDTVMIAILCEDLATAANYARFAGHPPTTPDTAREWYSLFQQRYNPQDTDEDPEDDEEESDDDDLDSDSDDDNDPEDEHDPESDEPLDLPVVDTLTVVSLDHATSSVTFVQDH